MKTFLEYVEAQGKGYDLVNKGSSGDLSVWAKVSDFLPTPEQLSALDSLAMDPDTYPGTSAHTFQSPRELDEYIRDLQSDMGETELLDKYAWLR